MNEQVTTTYKIDPWLERLAALMDDQFELFGFRFGVNFIIDLVPGVGDILTTLISLFIFSAALRYNISKFTIVRMIWNIVIYFVIGLIPWLGDLFGAWWKPNKRNLDLVRNSIRNA